MTAVFAAVFACSRAAYAEETAPLELPPVVVEKDRSVAETENRLDSTGTVTAVPREELNRPGENLTDTLDRQAGVSAIRLGGLGDFSAASIRGSSFDQVMVFLDGIPLNAGLGGAVDLSALPAANLDRMEIFRGFAPVEASGSALGGALYLYSREITENSFSSRGGYGSYNTIESGFAAAAKGNATRGFAGLDFMHSRGDFSFLNDNGTVNDRTDDFTQKYHNRDFDRLGTLFKIEHDLSSSSRLTLVQDLFYREGGLQRGGSVVNDRTRLQIFRTITGLELKHTGPVTGTDEIRLQFYNTFARNEIEDFLGEIWGFPQNDVKKSYSPGAALTYRAGAGPLSFTGHFNYRFERYTPRHRIPTVFTDGTSDRHGTTVAAGAEFEVPEAKLLLAAQYRFEYNSNRFRPASNSATSSPPVTKDSDGGHTVRGGVLWKPVDGLKVRGNIGRGFRFPSLYELFGDTGFVLGNPKLKPESGINADAGVEFAARPDPFGFTGGTGFFYQKTDDLIQFARSTVYTKPENAGSVKVLGAETWASAALLKTVRLDATHTFLNSRIRSKIPSRDGRKLTNRPPNQWTLKATIFRDLNSGVLDHAALWSELEFTAAHFVDGNNRVSVPERHLFGLGATARFFQSRLTVAVEAKNLTNEEVLDVVGFPLPGRTFFGRLEWKFL